MKLISLLKYAFGVNETYIISGILLLTFVLFYFINNLIKKRYKLPPGPIGFPILGYLPFLGSEPYRTLNDLSHKYGNVFSLYLGQTLAVICNDWTSTEEAFSKVETLDRPSNFFDAVPGGLGLSGANGKDWSEQRKFSAKTMKDIGLGRSEWGELLMEEVDVIKKMIEDSKGKPMDVRRVLSSTFTNNMMTLLFGERVATNDPMTTTFTDYIDYTMEELSVINSALFLPRLCNFLSKFGLYGSKEGEQKIAEFSRLLGKYTDKKMEKQNKVENSFIDIYYKEVENQKKNPHTYITERSFYGNVKSLMLGGSETVRTAFVWLVLEIAKHKEVQKKIQDEIDYVLGSDGKLSWSEHDKLPYTYSVILEALRYRTIVPVNTLRMTNADIKIQGFDVPKGTVVIVNQWALHNDTNYWSEPSKFKPERFMADGGKKINKSPKSFVPFSFGRRSCPGKLIALMELFTYIVTILQNYDILPPENGDIKYESIYGFTYQAKCVDLCFVPRSK